MLCGCHAIPHAPPFPLCFRRASRYDVLRGSVTDVSMDGAPRKMKDKFICLVHCITYCTSMLHYVCVFNYAGLWLKTHSFMPVMFSGKRLSAVASRNGVSFAFVCFMICIPRMNICSWRMYEIVRSNNRKHYCIYCTFFPVFMYFSVVLVQGAHKRTLDFQKGTEKTKCSLHDVPSS